jgi:hypothetical protein
MDALTLYLVFAVTTGICCWLFFYVPIVQEAKKLGIDNTFTRSPTLSSITYICISILVAPSLFIPLFSEEKGELFRKALRSEILKQE